MRKWAQVSGNVAPIHSLIPDFVRRIPDHSQLRDHSLYRVFYYDGEPFKGKIENPLDGTVRNFGKSDEFYNNQDMLTGLESMSHVAVRRGKTKFRGWKINPPKSCSESDIKINANDLRPRVEQKGVDMRIGLDIAALSLKQFVDVLVLVSGDSDFVPALKFARTEGRQIVLFTLDHDVAQELKIHTDVCVEDTLGDIMAS